jgi:predicted anti-sigma-YlaC factor YlaD
MTDRCPTGFDEPQLSGYLDRELTQAETQRVRLHLEDCPSCRALLADLAGVRAASRATPFRPPPDDQWDERPRTAASFLARRVGWTLVVAWLAAVAAYALWQLATAPEGLEVKLAVFSIVAGPVLLFLSVLFDRLRTLRTDRYRRVLK